MRWLVWLNLTGCSGLTVLPNDTSAEDSTVSIETDLPPDTDPETPTLPLGEGSFQLGNDPMVVLAVNCVQVPEQPFRQVGTRDAVLPEWSFTLSFGAGAPIGESTLTIGAGVAGELVEYAEGIAPTRTFNLVSGEIQATRTSDGVGTTVQATAEDVESTETFELTAQMACAWTD